MAAGTSDSGTQGGRDAGNTGDYKAEDPWSSLEDVPEVVRGLVASPVKGGLIVQVNSDVVFTELSESLAAQRVILTDLYTAAKEHEELVQRYLYQAGSRKSIVYLLHTAPYGVVAFFYMPRTVSRLKHRFKRCAFRPLRLNCGREQQQDHLCRSLFVERG